MTAIDDSEFIQIITIYCCIIFGIIVLDLIIFDYLKALI